MKIFRFLYSKKHLDDYLHWSQHDIFKCDESVKNVNCVKSCNEIAKHVVPDQGLQEFLKAFYKFPSGKFLKLLQKIWIFWLYFFHVNQIRHKNNAFLHNETIVRISLLQIDINRALFHLGSSAMVTMMFSVWKKHWVF